MWVLALSRGGPPSSAGTPLLVAAGFHVDEVEDDEAPMLRRRIWRAISSADSRLTGGWASSWSLPPLWRPCDINGDEGLGLVEER